MTINNRLFMGVAGLVLVAALPAHLIGGHSTIEIQTTLQTIATLLAFCIGVILLVRFYSQRHAPYLFMGSAFLAAAFLEAYNTFITSAFVVDQLESPLQTLIPWGSAATRTGFGLLLCLGLLVQRRQPVNEFWVYGVVTVMTLGTFAFFWVASLPSAYSDLFVSRPQEFVPGVLFLIALGGYWRRGGWRTDPLEKWLIVLLIINVGVHSLYIPFSDQLYDPLSISARLWKVGGYLIMFGAALQSMYGLFKQVETQNHALNDVNSALKDTNARLQTSEDNLRARVEELQTLHEIDRELGYTLNIHRALELAVEIFLRYSQASDCVITWIKDETQLLERLAGFPQLFPDPVSIERLATSPFGQVLNEDRLFLRLPLDAPRCDFYLPLMTRRKRAGVVFLRDMPSDLFDHREKVDFLLHLARRVATAIENAQFYNRVQDRAEQINRLYTLSTNISSSMDTEEIIRLSTQGMAVLLNGSRALYGNYDNYSQTITVRDGPKIAKADFGELWEPLLHDAVQLRVNDPKLSVTGRRLLSCFNAVAVLLYPLMVDGKLLGMFALCEADTKRFFLPSEIALGASLVVHASIALKQALLVRNMRELEQTKSQMVQMVSHDLRSPLGQMRGFMDLLKKELPPDFPPEPREYVEIMDTVVTKMTKLVNDLLEIERVESEYEITLEFVDVLPVLQAVSDGLAAQARLKGQTYTLELPPNTIKLLCSPIQLGQVFMNLISNAFKYTPEGGAIRARAQFREGRFEFEVSDTGFGIPPERQGRIFERFYRAKAPGTEEVMGSGLGLSLVKTIVERHNGEVWFKSELGKGSTFGFWLPSPRLEELAVGC